MSSKSGIVIKGTMDFQSVLTFLEDVVKSFREKTVCVQRGDEYITLKPAESIEMELEAVEKKGKQRLSLELTWREEVPAETELPFKVSCEAPLPKEEPVSEEPPLVTEPDLPGATVIAMPAQGLGTPAKVDAKTETKPEIREDAKPKAKK